MKLKDIINNLDKSPSNQDDNCTYDMEDLVSELSLDCWGVGQDYKNPRLKCYWLANHLCTDTYVGYRAYFLDDEFVCLSHQFARKSDEVFKWVSTETQTLVRNYILSLVEDDFEPDDNILDLEEDFGEGYPVHYVGQLLRKDVLLNDEVVTVVKEDRIVDGEYNFHNIEVRNSEGEEFEADIRDIVVPWYTV